MGKDDYTSNPWLQKSRNLDWTSSKAGPTRFDKHSYSTFVSNSGVTVNGLTDRATRRVYQHEFEMRKSQQNIHDEDMYTNVAGGRRHYKVASTVEIAHPESRLIFDQDGGINRCRNTQYFYKHTMTSEDHPLNNKTLDVSRPSTAPTWQTGSMSNGGINQADHFDPLMGSRKRHMGKNMYDHVRQEENLRDDRNVELQRNLKTDHIRKYEEIRQEQQLLREKYPHGVPKKVAIDAQKRFLDVGVAGYDTHMDRPFTRSGYRP